MWKLLVQELFVATDPPVLRVPCRLDKATATLIASMRRRLLGTRPSLPAKPSAGQGEALPPLDLESIRPLSARPPRSRSDLVAAPSTAALATGSWGIGTGVRGHLNRWFVQLAAIEMYNTSHGRGRERPEGAFE